MAGGSIDGETLPRESAPDASRRVRGVKFRGHLMVEGVESGAQVSFLASVVQHSSYKEQRRTAKRFLFAPLMPRYFSSHRIKTTRKTHNVSVRRESRPSESVLTPRKIPW